MRCGRCRYTAVGGLSPRLGLGRGVPGAGVQRQARGCRARGRGADGGGGRPGARAPRSEWVAAPAGGVGGQSSRVAADPAAATGPWV